MASRDDIPSSGALFVNTLLCVLLGLIMADGIEIEYR